MPSPAIFKYKEFDCWRTWFIEECEQSKLFGLTQGHRSRVTSERDGRTPYCVGTYIYLEDAPWYSRGGRKYHRICGPYEVVAMVNLPQGATPVHIVDDNVIIYEEAHPERGPWCDGIVPRNINGKNVDIIQTASKYDHYPYRFGIRRATNWKDDKLVMLKNN